MKLRNKKGQFVKGHRDFREVLDRTDVDIVHIATPPHWHGLMSVMAAEAGKDVWCEKPMTRTIGEGKRVVEAMQAHGRMFRLNTWFRFKDNFFDLLNPTFSLIFCHFRHLVYLSQSFFFSFLSRSIYRI